MEMMVNMVFVDVIGYGVGYGLDVGMDSGEIVVDVVLMIDMVLMVDGYCLIVTQLKRCHLDPVL